MAVLFGLNGIVRGRQGNNVFSVQNGTQVLKIYQPVVANPKSLGQRAQRSKFALAGKMSAATPSVALVGMRGGSPRSRRAQFVSVLTRNAIVSDGETGIVASVDYGKILFSQGSVPVYSAVPTITAVWVGSTGRESVSVTISAMTTQAIAPENYGERYVVALFDGITYNLEEVRTGIRSKTSQAGLFFRVGDRRDLRVVVYTIPFLAQASALAFRTSNLYDSEMAVNLLGSQSEGAASFEYGESVLLNVIPVLGTTQMHAASPDGEADEDNR